MGLLADLATVVGDEHVVAPPPAHLTVDWRGRPGGPVLAGVRPGDTGQVAAVVAACRRAGAGVITVGGNTGLVGGTLAPQHSDRPLVCVSTERLTGLVVDHDAGTALAGAATTISAVHRAAEAAGWTFGVDFAARDSATVGGAVATNAGGMRVCAYGTMRRQVLGLEAVLGDGSVVTDLAGLAKDNTGWDLRDLLIGSEGCLGIVTSALLHLHPPVGERLTVGAATASLREALALARALGACGRTMAAEFVDAASWNTACAELDLRNPVKPAAGGYAVLVELARADEDRLAGVLEASPSAVLAQHAGERATLWQPREGQTEWWASVAAAQRRAGLMLHKFDVAIPLGRLDEVVARLQALVSAWPGATGWGVFGHLLEGSLHVQVIAPDAAEPAGRLLAAIAAAGGTISAEHGIGRDKASYLALRRSPAELAAMGRIKRALDPDGIMNPGAVLTES